MSLKTVVVVAIINPARKIENSCVKKQNNILMILAMPLIITSYLPDAVCILLSIIDDKEYMQDLSARIIRKLFND